jgi:tetratricopeptide (TPR) repeat protein
MQKTLFFLLTVSVIGCSQANSATPDLATLRPTITEVSTDTPASATCADLEATWGDWPRAIDVLHELIVNGQTCGEEPLASKLYAALFNDGTAREQSGDFSGAIAQYQNAFNLNPRRDEAMQALARLGNLPLPTPTVCNSSIPPNSDPALADPPDPALFVIIAGDQFQFNNVPFNLKGVNYYPRHAVWHEFLTHADTSEMAAELDLIQQAGFNTLRIFLWYDALFTCTPEQAIPDEVGFARLDSLLDLARTRNLKVIVTLNDLPDLYFRPIYTDYARYDAQTIYLIRRYRNDPIILAWDIRNEGDLDYGADGRPARFTQEQVIGWLAHTSQLVKQNDPYHLITAGWWGDPTETDAYVDFLSFHHWVSAEMLAVRVANYRTRTTKPILLEEVGYYSWESAPQLPQSDAVQADALSAAASTAQANNMAGWLVWTAFDFSPPPDQAEHYEHHFGLWTLDLIPKPALTMLPLP